ncbi:hypothetical protein J7E63_15640 [Bacillus sp. ISL-75]|uniref:hypothetical protein n=1 Tax=Bacillus sp. ISL-75 TaxID=2819137 RepID=UPI001BE797DD|nr:hypothetical protein [Bacillus sp. ISL-75]MBT2728363.1 hypothetical protein [Bacillus sp. ISL-75]
MKHYLLMDLERTIVSGAPCYWKANKYGYTYEVDYAGVFTQDLADEIVKNDLDQKTVLVPLKLIKQYGLGS